MIFSRRPAVSSRISSVSWTFRHRRLGQEFDVGLPVRPVVPYSRAGDRVAPGRGCDLGKVDDLCMRGTRDCHGNKSVSFGCLSLDRGRLLHPDCGCRRFGDGFDTRLGDTFDAGLPWHTIRAGGRQELLVEREIAEIDLLRNAPVLGRKDGRSRSNLSCLKDVVLGHTHDRGGWLDQRLDHSGGRGGSRWGGVILTCLGGCRDYLAGLILACFGTRRGKVCGRRQGDRRGHRARYRPGEGDYRCFNPERLGRVFSSITIIEVRGMLIPIGRDPPQEG